MAHYTPVTGKGGKTYNVPDQLAQFLDMMGLELVTRAKDITSKTVPIMRNELKLEAGGWIFLLSFTGHRHYVCYYAGTPTKVPALIYKVHFKNLD